MSSAVPHCLGFLRELEAHAVRRLRSEEVPHVGDCSSCRNRLEAAVRQARLLSSLRTPVPAELRSPAFLEGIYDRVLADQSEPGRPAVRALEAGLQGVAAPERLEWPSEAMAEPRTVAAVQGPVSPPSTAVLWTRIRQEVQERVAVRRTSRQRRLRVQAALVAASLLVGAWFATNWGTSQPPEIVFDRLADMPPVDLSPVAVLRQALGD